MTYTVVCAAWFLLVAYSKESGLHLCVSVSTVFMVVILHHNIEAAGNSLYEVHGMENK